MAAATETPVEISPRREGNNDYVVLSTHGGGARWRNSNGY